MPQYLRPHSSSWFEALEAYNADQAAATGMIIALAGRDDVCSICGDHPASDYEIVEEHVDADAIATIRLCQDCLGIRKEIYGETFVAWRDEAERR
jgi:hypothetical protein